MRRLLAVLGAAALLAAGCTDGDPPRTATPPAASGATADLPACPEPGTPATVPAALPDLELTCLGGGGTVSLRRLTGTPTVLNVWATWCGPCREELPAFGRLQADAGTRLRVVGVAQDAPGRSAEYAADNALPFPSVQDETGDLSRALRRRGLPLTVLVGADGTVLETYQGRPLTDATLRALVRDTLGVDV